MAHEHNDVNVRVLGRYLAAFTALGIVTLIAITIHWRLLQGADAARAPSLSRWTGLRELPPSPRLQTEPKLDLNEYLREQQQRMKGIEDAMDRISREGLPQRPEQPQESQDGRFGNEPAAR